MYIIKILILFCHFCILYIVFSLNTLLSIFCFIIIIFINGVLLLNLHIEYLTFLILLLYLGGILIFFLFTTLMLSNEYSSTKDKHSWFSLENIFYLILVFKAIYFLTYLNARYCFFINTSQSFYLPTFIENNYFYTELLKNQGDIIGFLSLYMEKPILLLIIGFILLFTMIGVIVITRSKNV